MTGLWRRGACGSHAMLGRGAWPLSPKAARCTSPLELPVATSARSRLAPFDESGVNGRSHPPVTPRISIAKQSKSPSSSASRICLTIVRQTPCLSYNFSTGAALVARAPPMAATYPPPAGLHAQRSGRWPASGSRTPQHLTHSPGPNESATRVHQELLVPIRWRYVTYTG